MTLPPTPHGVHALSADYGDGVDVLRGVDLGIDDGELFTVLGPSGSGKSTLLRTIAGLHPVRGGTVRVGDRDVTAAPPERRGVGLVPQDGSLFPRLTVAANIAYGLPGVRGRRALGHPRVRELLEVTDLSALAHRLPQELSGGQQQRVALARALAPAPRLMLLDEPFSALDAGLRARLRVEVVDVLRAQGVSTLLITHDQEEALSLSDRVGVLRAGRFAQIDTPARLYGMPVSAWVARFVGDAVLLPAEADGDGGARTALGPLTVRPGSSVGRGLYRPEQLALVPAAGAPRSERPAVDGTVERVHRFGSHALVRVRTPVPVGAPDDAEDDGLLTVRRPDLGDVAPGDRVRVEAAARGILVAS